MSSPRSERRVSAPPFAQSSAVARLPNSIWDDKIRPSLAIVKDNRERLNTPSLNNPELAKRRSRLPCSK